MRKIVPCDILQAEENTLKLKSIIIQNIPKIEKSLVGDLQWYAQNALLVPGSIKVISVEAQGQHQYKMLYQFDWNVFNACLDINQTESRQETIDFEVIAGALAFNVIDNTRPSTADEL
ncbi:hypothetical protein ACFSFZ_05180 [Mixta tenebrionis]|uniref:Uncharacterized protein n=1 Tax=Mixta tenebrionis TaxID=2562439 RepID=A0A506V5U8_9GAMM|nr:MULTISPECIES: hypothetical protein [Mixta]QHM76339.1 hypothetical protein C7M52_02315 [Mixta theicola]TPW41274.1 hypothetical protein FKM52_15600 [Mixta tenebrionis]